MPQRKNPKKSNAPRRRNGNGGARAKATRQLAQGAAQVATKALGSRVARIPRSLSLACWNAHSSAHAGLPRAVGPYSVVRTTKLITSKSPLLMFGSFATRYSNVNPPQNVQLGNMFGSKMWTNVCCVGAREDILSSAFSSTAIGADAVTQIHSIPLPGSNGNGTFAQNTLGTEPATFVERFSNTTAVPSAISVQIINPTAVQTAAGTAVAAVCPVRLDLHGSAKSWGSVADELLSFYRPRVLTGGKLALRGVQMDSIPLSMTDVSDFRELWEVDEVLTTPSHILWSDRPAVQAIVGHPGMTTNQKMCPIDLHPEGWAPLVYYNPYNASKEDAERQEMSFLVTFEWRTRFDISNPACASHELHKPTSDIDWHKMLATAADKLPGVIDIVEKVANTGMKFSGVANKLI